MYTNDDNNDSVPIFTISTHYNMVVESEICAPKLQSALISDTTLYISYCLRTVNMINYIMYALVNYIKFIKFIKFINSLRVATGRAIDLHHDVNILWTRPGNDISDI